MVGPVFMLVVRDLRLLSYLLMDRDLLYIKLKLNITDIQWYYLCLDLYDNSLYKWSKKLKIYFGNFIF